MLLATWIIQGNKEEAQCFTCNKLGIYADKIVAVQTKISSVLASRKAAMYLLCPTISSASLCFMSAYMQNVLGAFNVFRNDKRVDE